MCTCTQNMILHHEDCLARSLYPWKRSKTRLLFRHFGLVVDDQGNGFANEQWSFVLWPRLCIINQSNSVSWHVLMVWRNNNKHPVFPRIKRFRARCMVKKVGAEQKRGIRSEKFARQAKAWTTEIVWIYICVLLHGLQTNNTRIYVHLYKGVPPLPGSLLQNDLNSEGLNK